MAILGETNLSSAYEFFDFAGLGAKEPSSDNSLLTIKILADMISREIKAASPNQTALLGEIYLNSEPVDLLFLFAAEF